VGNFDGKNFSSQQAKTHWVDYGTDNYAGVTWSNVDNRAIAIGWMSNWQYAEKVPTQPWRGAHTFPRELKLKSIADTFYIASEPIKELGKIVSNTQSLKDVTINGSFDLSAKVKSFNGRFLLQLKSEQLENYSIVLSNDLGEELIIGYDKQADHYYIDRSKTGKTGFENGFGKKHIAPRLSTNKNTDATLLIDVASAELFTDDGLTVMTDIFFSNKPMNKVAIQSTSGIRFTELSYSTIESIWK
jgi:fructan beta-fructosidase